MSAKDYVALAEILGNAFYSAMNFGGEEARTLVYDSVYTPIVEYLEKENPRFDMTRFSFATAQHELGLAKEHSDHTWILSDYIPESK